LEGELTIDECREHVYRATRNYAKRQYTWFRNQLDANRQYSDVGVSEMLAISSIEDFLLTADN